MRLLFSLVLRSGVRPRLTAGSARRLQNFGNSGGGVLHWNRAYRDLMAHPAVVLLNELITERDRSVLVFERVPGIDLGRHTAAQPGGRLEEAGAHDVVLQLAGALRYFHGMGVAHMDLKPENCMREPEGRLR